MPSWLVDDPNPVYLLLGVVALGLIIGIPVAFGMGRGLSGLLYGVKPSDPATFIGIPLLVSWENGELPLLSSPQLAKA